MRATIIYPPLTSTPASSPPPSLAALKAYLCSHGAVSVETRDFNTEFLHFFLNNYRTFLPILENCFRMRLERTTNSNHLDRSLSVLLYIYLPLFNQLINQSDSYKFQRSLIQLLRDMVREYYTSDLLGDGNFLQCDYHTLSHFMNQHLSDPIMTHFIQSSSLKRSDLLGFSLLAESQLPFAVLLSRLFRTKYPNLHTVAGGPYITEILTRPLSSEELFEDFDYLVAQEGESALCSIIESLTTGQAIRHPNVYTSTNSKGRTPLIEPIESLPPLDFEGLDLNLYFTSDLSLPAYSSKGCTWGKCKFCSQNSLSYREKTVEAFVSELQCISDHSNVTHFQFTDENIRPVRLRELSEEITKRELNIRWFIQVRLDKDLDYKLLELMKIAGCYAIEFGLESGSSELLRKMKKGIDLRIVERILKDCADLDYIVTLNCMVGFPEETIEFAEQTVSFIDSITKNIPRLKLVCNTQNFKIYTTSRYATSGEVNYSLYPLSVVANWQPPIWLNKFRQRFRDHIIFTGQMNVSRNKNVDCTPAVKEELKLSLSPCFYLLNNIRYDFATQTLSTKPHSYLIDISSGVSATRIFLINDVMRALVEELKCGGSKLHLLREGFYSRYHNFDKESIESAFLDGIMRLNDIGAIHIC